MRTTVCAHVSACTVCECDECVHLYCKSPIRPILCSYEMGCHKYFIIMHSTVVVHVYLICFLAHWFVKRGDKFYSMQKRLQPEHSFPHHY